MPTLEEDQLITAAAESDPDALPLTDEQMSTMDPIRLPRAPAYAAWFSGLRARTGKARKDLARNL